MKESIHLKGLNGLRAIAAFGVLLTHTASPPSYLGNFISGELAIYSVTIFFTLSGFLITYLLFLEKKQQPVNIKKFYLRRLLRIWPLYFAYLLIVIVITCYQGPEKFHGQLPYYFFFAANVPAMFINSIPLLGHYWSLGVEEQFYLFWPWLIKLAKNVLAAVVGFTVLFLLCKLVVRLFFFDAGHPFYLHAFFVTRFECMSIGGIGALLCLKKHRLFFRLTANRFTEIICWTCLALVAAGRYFVSPFVNHDIIALVTVCLIMNLSFNSKAIISLENRVFNFIGKISYGIYVIHPLVIFGLKELFGPIGAQPLWRDLFYAVTVITCTILTAWLSYEYFEKRFLRMKDRFSVVKSNPGLESVTLEKERILNADLKD